MKAFLMHPDSDFATQPELPPNEEALTQDLELNTLLASMAGGDSFLFDVAKRALLLSLRDPDAIVYRQEIVSDCLENPSVVRDLYVLAGEALKAEKSVWGGMLRDSPRSMLGTSVQTGHDRGAHPTARASVSCACDPESDRVRGHLSVARGAA